MITPILGDARAPPGFHTFGSEGFPIRQALGAETQTSMYRQFYGLTSQPFSLHPVPAHFYPCVQFTTANTIMEYAVLHREGILVITGEVGCGKTMLVRRFQASGAGESCVGVVSDPSALEGSLTAGILLAFRQQVPAEQGALLHASLRGFLKAQQAAGRPTILVVDEAQGLSREVLERLRLLTNPEPDGSGALQLVLVGQPQLQQLLYRPDLSQLLQRVIAHYHLQPLSEAETAGYVVHRLQVAGCTRAIFTPAAIAQIHQGSSGIPRLINMICDMALLYGYTEELEEIDASTIAQVVADRGLGGSGFGPGSIRRTTSLSAPLAVAATEPTESDREMIRELFAGAGERS
jgi:general secretion pathway protein A